MNRIGLLRKTLAIAALLMPAMILVTTTSTAQSGFELLSPNGGEKLVPGSVVNIIWTGVRTDATDTVNIEYSVDGGVLWSTIAQGVTDTSYRWTVPDSLSNRCRIRVHHLNGIREIGDTLYSFEVPKRPFGLQVRYSPDGTLFSVAHGDSLVRIMRASDGAVVADIMTSGRITGTPSFDRTNARLVIPINNGNRYVEIWDLATRTKVRTLGDSARFRLLRNAQFTADGRQIAVAGRPSTSFWDIASGERVDSLPEPAISQVVEFSRDWSRFATRQSGGITAIWDAATHRLLDTFSTGGAMELSPDGKRLLGVSPALTLRDVDTRAIIWQWQRASSQEPSMSGALTRNPGNVLMWGGDVRDLRLVELTTGDTLMRVPALRFPELIEGVAVQPGGTQFVVGVNIEKFYVYSFAPFDQSDQNFSIERSSRAYPDTDPIASGLGITEIAPLPANDRLSVEIRPAGATTLTVRIIDMTGRERLLEQATPTSATSLRMQLDLSGLPAGAYLLYVSDQRTVRTHGFLIQR